MGLLTKEVSEGVAITSREYMGWTIVNDFLYDPKFGLNAIKNYIDSLFDFGNIPRIIIMNNLIHRDLEIFLEDSGFQFYNFEFQDGIIDEAFVLEDIAEQAPFIQI